MAYAEKRGNLWRSRWRGSDGTLESKPGFTSRRAAENYGRDQEAAIRNNTYVEPRAGRITLTEWVNMWFPAQNLELNTLSTYRYTIEVHILPAFGNRTLASLTPEEIAVWEKQIAARGYTGHTVRESRSTLNTILADAIPRYIQANPAARRRGKGRKGQRRIEQAEKEEKTWATALEVLLFAERCSVLSGTDTDFVMVLTMAYTGMRWSEAMGLGSAGVHGQALDIAWKLYELDGRFYRGRPKDGSIRTVDIPPFLGKLLSRHLQVSPDRKCICRNSEPPWCQGDEYVFLGPQNGHFRRSNYAVRVVRPAADGWHPARQGRYARETTPVLVDAGARGPVPRFRRGRPPYQAYPSLRQQAGVSREWLAKTATDAAPPVPAASCSAGTDGLSATRRRRGCVLVQGKARPTRCRSRPGCQFAPASHRTAFGTATRRGWTSWASVMSFSPSGWATRCRACAVSTATSRRGCALNSKPGSRNCGKHLSTNARCSRSTRS
jgi:integrase